MLLIVRERFDVVGVGTLFWVSFTELAIIAGILALIGAVLAKTIGKRYSFVRYLAYVVIGYLALLLLASPLTLVARYVTAETVNSTNPGCSSHRFEVVGESLAGNEVFSLNSITDWCSDGSTITRSPFFRTSVSTPALFWSFGDYIAKHSSGGEGEWSHSDFVHARFSYCPSIVRCVQHAYPIVVKHQYRDGTATAEYYE